MRCLHPLICWSVPATPDKPYRHLVFKPSAGMEHMKHFQIPCGKCVSCLINKKRCWVIRCCHEFEECDRVGAFITLTYEDKYLPVNDKGEPFLEKTHFQKFVKRLRANLWRGLKLRFRFFGCGEYGSRTGRPHYHLLVFGVSPLVLQNFVDLSWRFAGRSLGFITVQDLNVQRIEYTCGYVLKKMQPTLVGDKPTPEFRLGSKGLGAAWIDKYWREVLNNGVIHYRGKQYPIPEYYIRRLSESHNDDVVSAFEAYICNLGLWLGNENLSTFYEDYFARIFVDRTSRAFKNGVKNENI